MFVDSLTMIAGTARGCALVLAGEKPDLWGEPCSYQQNLPIKIFATTLQKKISPTIPPLGEIFFLV